MESCDTLDNAAMLISYLPATDAEQLLQRIPPERAEAIRRRASTHNVPPALRLATARRFIREMDRALPAAKHRRIDPNHPRASSHILAEQLPSRLADALTDELPQTTAVVLSLLSNSKAADVLTLLPAEYQIKVAHHMLHSDPVSDDVLYDLADSLARVVSRHRVIGGADRPGPDRLSSVLQCTDVATRRRLAEAARRQGFELDELTDESTSELASK